MREKEKPMRISRNTQALLAIVLTGICASAWLLIDTPEFVVKISIVVTPVDIRDLLLVALDVL